VEGLTVGSTRDRNLSPSEIASIMELKTCYEKVDSDAVLSPGGLKNLVLDGLSGVKGLELSGLTLALAVSPKNTINNGQPLKTKVSEVDETQQVILPTVRESPKLDLETECEKKISLVANLGKTLSALDPSSKKITAAKRKSIEASMLGLIQGIAGFPILDLQKLTEDSLKNNQNNLSGQEISEILALKHIYQEMHSSNGKVDAGEFQNSMKDLLGEMQKTTESRLTIIKSGVAECIEQDNPRKLEISDTLLGFVGGIDRAKNNIQKKDRKKLQSGILDS
jgi:hypothetical protein